MGQNSLRIEIELFPKQRELLHAVYDYRESLFGGSRGGGKSGGIRRIQLIRRITHARSKGAIFRKTYPELEKNHIRKIFEEFPQLRQYYNQQNRVLTFPHNKSTLEFCYAERLADIDTRMQGNEWDDISIDEVGAWSEEEYVRLHHCNRSTGCDINTSAYHSANPGGVGHRFLKDRFITKTKVPEGITTSFIPALVEDNPVLMRDPGYLLQLESEPNKALREAFRHGNWDILAGQYFSLDRSTHMVEPFEIPAHWHRWGSYDYGFNHPAVWLWWAVFVDGIVFVSRVYAWGGVGVLDQAEHVMGFDESAGLTWWAGLDCWHHKNMKKAKDPTIAEDLKKAGLTLKPAHVDRKQGAHRARMYLSCGENSDRKKRTGPRVFFFKTCPVVFDCITRMVHDPKDIEDVLKVDSVNGDPYTGDDGYDAFRYGIMRRPPIVVLPRPKLVDEYRSEGYNKVVPVAGVTGWTV